VSFAVLYERILPVLQVVEPTDMQKYGYLEYLKLNVLKAKSVKRFETVKVKVKFKLTVKKATKAQRGSKCIALLFL
jgi:hypothetical protein